MLKIQTKLQDPEVTTEDKLKAVEKVVNKCVEAYGNKKQHDTKDFSDIEVDSANGAVKVVTLTSEERVACYASCIDGLVAQARQRTKDLYSFDSEFERLVALSPLLGTVTLPGFESKY